MQHRRKGCRKSPACQSSPDILLHLVGDALRQSTCPSTVNGYILRPIDHSDSGTCSGDRSLDEEGATDLSQEEEHHLPMSILMVGAKTFPPVIGGIETHVYEVSRRMAARGVDVTVIVPSVSLRKKEELVQGVRVLRAPAIPGSFILKISTIPFIVNHMRKNPGRVLHAHDAPGGFAAAFGSPRGSFVYTMHGLGFSSMDWPSPFRQVIRLMQTLAVRRAGHLFCMDETALACRDGWRGTGLRIGVL